MAKFEVTGIDEELDILQKIASNYEEILDEGLKKAGEIIEERVRARMNSVLSGKSTGAMASGLGVSPVKTDRSGFRNIKVGFEGRDAKGVSNALKASVLEYGKKNQRARPFLAPAAKESKAMATAALKKYFDAEIERITK